MTTKTMLIIDPGHGGRDQGGGSNRHWQEKDKVLDISLYQYERFRQLNVPVLVSSIEHETRPLRYNDIEPNARITGKIIYMIQ